jgi:hypothetical protein
MNNVIPDTYVTFNINAPNSTQEQTPPTSLCAVVGAGVAVASGGLGYVVSGFRWVYASQSV